MNKNDLKLKIAARKMQVNLVKDIIEAQPMSTATGSIFTLKAKRLPKHCYE